MAYDPATSLLGLYPDKVVIRKDACPSVFIKALFTIVKTWKQSRCLSTDEQIKEMCYIYIYIYSAIKKNAVAAAAAALLQSCLTLRPHRQQPTRLPHPWDSPGKNTGVGCHFLLQCMKVKSESEVAQSCLTLSDPMDFGLPCSSAHGIFQARVLEWGASAFSKKRMK